MRAKKTKASFTLIEMLVVIVIILLLTGILLRVTTLIGRKSAVVRVEYELQQIQNALNEFFAEYGHYPPLSGDPKSNVEYEFENCSSNYQSEWFRETFLPQHDEPGVTNASDPGCFFADMERPFGQLGYTGQEGWYLGYRYGLVSYLYERQQGAQQHWYDRDTGRDVHAKRKWLHFIDDICLPANVFRNGSSPHPTPPGLQSQAPYTNSVFTLRDKWGRNYRYVSYPPFTRYKLWSAGPDGKDDTSDDVHGSSE